ncbi:UNVERIFIED_ORG: polar amino acid transport system substrate-binding protein [Variovorax paradoxus]|jgi:polar amino acid transport system substrate-binding protein|nr:polar amino acid transport system substrate-binding protein [Variovorax paradoxus]
MFTRRTLGMAGAAIAAAFAFTSSMAHAQSDTLARIQQAKKIRIAMDPGVPPWSFKNEKLEMSGSEYETARLLARDLGVELEMVTTNGANRIPQLVTDKADLVVAAMTITPERQKVIDFSLPYSGTTTAVSAPRDMAIKSMADLVGKRVGVARGTAMDIDLTGAAPKGAEIVRFEDEATTLTAVLSGQVDIVAQSVTLNEAVNRRNPAKALETKIVLRNSLHGMGMRKNDTRLKAWVDQWVRTNMANGTLQAVFRKYQGIDLPAAVVEAAK